MARSILILDQGEHLLELVEDDQELGIGVGEDAIDRSDETERRRASSSSSSDGGGSTATPRSADSSSRSG